MLDDCSMLPVDLQLQRLVEQEKLTASVVEVTLEDGTVQQKTNRDPNKMMTEGLVVQSW
jgi:hypothetical protein